MFVIAGSSASTSAPVDATLIDSSPKSAIVSLCSLVVSLLMFASVDESSIVGCCVFVLEYGSGPTKKYSALHAESV
jgi:hypothetical protein